MNLPSIVRRVCGFLLCAALVVSAQVERRPRTYAIQGARIVTATGAALEEGSIVLRDGLITAVAADAEIPEDAWVIDGAGLTVYPGFIDAMSKLGMPKGDPVFGKKPAAGPEDRPATSSWVVAADAYSPGEDEVEKMRGAGFTAVVAAPRNGIFPGQASLINLGDNAAPAQTIEPRAALVIRLPRSGGRDDGFPSSLFGEIAYVKQLFLDARRHQQALQIYRGNPAGLERPGYDRSLEPLVETLESERTALYPGNTATEIRRALAMKAETSDRLAVYGAQQAYAEGVAEELAQAGLSVLLNLSWPKADKDADPTEEIPLRVLRFRARAPEAAAALRAAGVRFGLYAGDADKPADFLAGVRAAIESGLSREDAVLALTRMPAEIFGVADRVGTLEAGKIANLAVYRDDPFAEKAKPEMVFIDGVKYEIRDDGVVDDE